MLYLNNSLSSSMLPDGAFTVETLSPEKAAEVLASEFTHCGNPDHWPTWNAVAVRLNSEKAKEAKGGRVALKSGDSVIVTEIGGLPRETREFTPEEIAKANFKFRLVSMR